MPVTVQLGDSNYILSANDYVFQYFLFNIFINGTNVKENLKIYIFIILQLSLF